MRKVLILLMCFQFQAFLISQNRDVPVGSLYNLKNWQLKGMTRSSIRLNDIYQARDLLEVWHRREPDNLKIRLKLATYLFQSRDYERAAVFFDKLWELDPDKYPEAGYYSALIMKIYGEYEQSLQILQTLRRRSRRIGGPMLTRSRLDNEITGCYMGIAARDTLVKTEVNRFNETINSPYIEFGPVLLGESTFVYGSVIRDSSDYIDLMEPYRSTKLFLEAREINGTWIGGYETKPPFVNYPGFDTGRGVFSIDRKRFYSVRCSLDNKGCTICHLYVSKLLENGWSQPSKLSKEINHPRFSSTHPAMGTCFDSALEVLYFVSDRNGGAGGKDIWFSVYNKLTTNYTKAENAGVFINTNQDEMTPYFDLPSHRIYFSSNGWPSLGGFDIFYANGDMTTWGLPVNVGRPINSSYDDLNLVQNYSAKFGLFASNRPGSMTGDYQSCCDDLYMFNETKSPRVMITGKLVMEDIIRESGIFKSAVLQTDEPVEKEVLRNQMVSVLMVRDSTSSVLLQEIQTNTDGNFEIWVDQGQEYQITVNNPSFVNNKFFFSTKNANKDETINVSTIALTYVSNQPITIENIYYEFNQAELTREAKEALDTTLLVLLNRYPTIQVEIASHTDNVGDHNFNQRLSEKRANNVVKYLISKGISRQRLSAKGYGESLPITPNQNENPEGRNRNRRTEFKITGLKIDNVFNVEK